MSIRIYYSAGMGIAPAAGGKLSKSIMDRIERLGRMNDRRKLNLGRRSRRGLLRLAAEYRRMGMPQMAAEVQEEADTL